MAAVSGSHERSSILVNEFDTEELLDSSRRQENKVFFCSAPFPRATRSRDETYQVVAVIR